MALTALSLPWFFLSIGLYTLGRDDDAERLMETSPICLFFDFVEGR